MKHYMCFDIGGTSVKFGVAGENGTLLQKNEIPNVITQKGVDGLVESLASVTERYRQEYDLRGIAVSTAGVVDPEKGLILYAPKYFPGYPGTALGERLEKCCNLPCTVENDVSSAGGILAWRRTRGEIAVLYYCRNRNWWLCPAGRKGNSWRGLLWRGSGAAAYYAG